MSEGRRLEVSLRYARGAMSIEVAFTLRAPWTVLFAPSGAGKSTVLRLLAGLLRPQAGSVVWHPGEGEAITLTETGSQVFLPAHRRGVRFVGQQAALFPHRTVLQNVAYGVRRGEAVEEMLRLCGIAHLAGTMPALLSGGERQRVALARALAPPACRVLLLDEPFSALDTTARQELIGQVRGWLTARGVPVLQVTHDVAEVLSLDAEVIRMVAGQVAAQGAAQTVLREERAWLAAQLARSGASRATGQT